MSKAKDLNKLLEDYIITEPGEKDSPIKRAFDSKEIRDMFIGTVLTNSKNEDPIQNLRGCIDKMPDKWVLEFLKVINGYEVE